MNKKILATAMSVLTLATCGAALTACGPTAPIETETEIIFNDKNNPYSELSWQDYSVFGTPSFNELTVPVVYQFEGSYSEAYQGDYSREYLYINCYEDGLLYGTLGGSGIYGYWTNRDRRDREQFVLHILRHGNSEYNDGNYDMLADPITDEGDYYEYSSSFTWNRGWGIRTVLIFGYKYTPIKEMTLDTSEVKTEYVMGERIDTSGLKINVTRENGKTTQLDDISANNGIRIFGFDSSRESDANKVTVRFRNIVASFDVKIIAPTYTGKGVYNNEQIDMSVKLTTPEDCTVTFDGKTANCKYTKSTILGQQVCTFMKPDSEEDPDIDLGLTDEEWASLHKRYVLTRDEETDTFNLEAFLTQIYTIPTWNSDFPSFDGDVRTNFEPMFNRIPGGNTEQRQIVLDSKTGVATLTYKYWNAGTTDTFELKYTLEDGVLTFTEQVRGSSGNGVTFADLYKEYVVTDDGIAIPKHLVDDGKVTL